MALIMTKAGTRIITNLNCEKILGKSAYHYGETHINKVEERVTCKSVWIA